MNRHEVILGSPDYDVINIYTPTVPIARRVRVPILRVRVRVKEVRVYSRVYSHVPTRILHKLYSYSQLYTRTISFTSKDNRKSVSVHTSE